MTGMTVFCIISGCTPEIASNLLYIHSFGPIVTSALKALADPHELASQDDVCVIAPVHPSGQAYAEGLQDGILSDTDPEPRARDLHPETDIRIVPHCVMGDSWDFGFVDGPPPNEKNWTYLVSCGCTLMVQTYALDIMALVTHGRMTPLRLWRLAMRQGFEDLVRPWCLEGVEYGEITGLWQQGPEEFPGFTQAQVMELEGIGEVEIVKRRLVNEGLYWVWMAPDRFPVSSTEDEYPTVELPEVHSCGNRSAIESVPPEVLIPIVSSLSLTSLLNLASASRSLRTGILGNDYCACVWIYNNAPWWIPVPTQTPKKDDQNEPPTKVTQVFPSGLGWAYIKRCIRSGSMRNRKRIWNAAVDIEHVADLAGV
ncbi:hypothetical protein HD554DRAFT_2191632 [Boletus coccyginus]|nr:hypothetical protein HD554DRAFT_2191632 [Boletus coccyginus]